MTDDEFRMRFNGLMEYAGISPIVSGLVFFDTVYKSDARVRKLAEKL